MPNQYDKEERQRDSEQKQKENDTWILQNESRTYKVEIMPEECGLCETKRNTNTQNKDKNTQTHTRARTHHSTPIVGGDDSDATAEAIPTCVGIALLLTATIQPGLHHTAMKWLFWPVNPYFLVFFIFSTAHTSHHILRYALVVGNHPGELKKSQESEKEKKDLCDHNRRESNPQPLDWKSLHIPPHHMGDVHTYTHHVPCIRPLQEKHANLQMHWMCTHRFSLIATIANKI